MLVWDLKYFRAHQGRKNQQLGNVISASWASNFTQDTCINTCCMAGLAHLLSICCMSGPVVGVQEIETTLEVSSGGAALEASPREALGGEGLRILAGAPGSPGSHRTMSQNSDAGTHICDRSRMKSVPQGCVVSQIQHL